MVSKHESANVHAISGLKAANVDEALESAMHTMHCIGRAFRGRARVNSLVNSHSVFGGPA